MRREAEENVSECDYLDDLRLTSRAEVRAMSSVRYRSGEPVRHGDLVHVAGEPGRGWYKVIGIDPSRCLVHILADLDGTVHRVPPASLVPAGGAA